LNRSYVTLGFGKRTKVIDKSDEYMYMRKFTKENSGHDGLMKLIQGKKQSGFR